MTEIRNRQILHCDMDAFFAAVEARENPALRGRPVVVGADPKGGRGRGVVSTASYEARRFGIRSAMPISEAWRRCPRAVFLKPRGHLYSQVGERIRRIFMRYTPLVEPVSVDEAFLDVTASTALFGDAVAIARRIKDDVASEERLTVSVGVAPNKFLAKVASDLHKPDGLTVVEPGSALAFLASLEIERIWGVGAKTAAHLHGLGVRTVADIRRMGEVFWREKLGAEHGTHLWALAHGVDERPVSAGGESRSLSHETTFDTDQSDRALLKRTLLALCEKVSRRLRREGYRGRTVVLKYRYAGFETHTRNRTLPLATCHMEGIHAAAREMFERHVASGRKIRLLGVGLSRLENLAVFLSLFEKDDPRNRIAASLDAVVRKHGHRAVTRAALLPAARRKTFP
jgi:nucleotidyltransferase/DNA polymerase involved in DNA repair